MGTGLQIAIVVNIVGIDIRRLVFAQQTDG